MVSKVNRKNRDKESFYIFGRISIYHCGRCDVGKLPFCPHHEDLLRHEFSVGTKATEKRFMKSSVHIHDLKVITYEVTLISGKRRNSNY